MNSRLALNQIARSQHALVTNEQALAAGLSPSQIRRRHRSGEWRVARPGVYAVDGAPLTWLQAVAAVGLASQPGAWISHQTAAAIWSLPGRDEAIHLVTGLDRRVRLDGVHGHRSGALFTADPTLHRRIPVATPARALVDLSAFMSYRQLASAVDDAIRRRIMTLESFSRCVGRVGEAPGRRLVVLHEVLADRVPGYDPGDSDLETRVLRLLVANGFPPPVQQHRVRLGRRTFKIDLAYRRYGSRSSWTGGNFTAAAPPSTRTALGRPFWFLTVGRSCGSPRARRMRRFSPASEPLVSWGPHRATD